MQLTPPLRVFELLEVVRTIRIGPRVIEQREREIQPPVRVLPPTLRVSVREGERVVDRSDVEMRSIGIGYDTGRRRSGPRGSRRI
jgi:hypothetical protein